MQMHDNKGKGLFLMVKGDYELTYVNWAETYLKRPSLLPIDYTDAGLLYMHIGDLAKAESYQKEALRVQPDFKWGYRNMIYLLAIQGRLEEAFDYSSRLLSFSGAFEDYLNTAHVLALLKRFTEAEKYLRDGLDRMETQYGHNELEGAYIFWMNNNKTEGKKRFMSRIEFCLKAVENNTAYAYKRAAYELASIYSFLGQEKEAYQWLRHFASMGFREGLENYIQIDPLFDPVRDQPEFKKIVEDARSQKAELQKRFRQLEKTSTLIKW
jgi:tetratricopeptide (TPR) repeat protein